LHQTNQLLVLISSAMDIQLSSANWENSHSYIRWDSDFKNTSEMAQLPVKSVTFCCTQCTHLGAGIVHPQLAWVTIITLCLERNHAKSLFPNEPLEQLCWA